MILLHLGHFLILFSHDTGPLNMEREEFCESTECVCRPSVWGWATTVGWLAGWLLDKLAFFNHLSDTKKLTKQLKEIKIKESSKIGSLILE
jgi:hypothetical protein